MHVSTCWHIYNTCNIWFDNGAWFPLTLLATHLRLIIHTNNQKKIKLSIKDFRQSQRSTFIYNQNPGTKQQQKNPNIEAQSLQRNKTQCHKLKLKSILSLSPKTTYNRVWVFKIQAHAELNHKCQSLKSKGKASQRTAQGSVRPGGASPAHLLRPL